MTASASTPVSATATSVPDRGTLRIAGGITFGRGSRHAVADMLAAFGHRALVVADPFLATTPQFEMMLTQIRAAGIDALVVADIAAELPSDALTITAARAAAHAPDVVVGYGGGSALDAAKVIALLIRYPGALEDYYGEHRVPGPTVPIVAVPTTAGTGSEVTPVAVVSDATLGTKIGLSSPYLIPACAVVDPELTDAAPVGVSVHSGADAFVHAVESFTARPLPVAWDSRSPVFTGRNVLTDPLSLAAAGLIFANLPRVAADQTDTAARDGMAYGSLLAGMAFGSTGTHLSHALQYPIGALTHTPHGLGTGMMLPFVLEACAASDPARIAVLGRAIGATVAGDDLTAAHETVDAIADFMRGIGLPETLSALGVAREDLASLAATTMSSGRLVAICPLDVDEALCLRVLEAAFDGDRLRLR